MKWKGGEKTALERLEQYTNKAVLKYGDTRNGLVGKNYSSKLSPWIANGSISVRKVYNAVAPAKTPQAVVFID